MPGEAPLLLLRLLAQLGPVVAGAGRLFDDLAAVGAFEGLHLREVVLGAGGDAGVKAQGGSLGEIAAKTGIPKTSLHRYLSLESPDDA
ncbi:helix-turn-helix domain-containing protein [Nonomuraea sp. NPDC049152]|uniref:helix-turn-helix domain-containing protein n=1 Tax=Nonomuraea sp. NPDC049152 TaxID=3154350 RepID=UPI0034047AB3